MNTSAPLRSKSTLAVYLAGAAGTAAFIAAPQVEAAVTAVTFGFGTEFNSADPTADWSVDGISGGNFGTLYGSSNGLLSLGNALPYGQGGVYVTGNNGAIGNLKLFSDGTVFGTGPIVNDYAGPSGNIGQGFAFYSNGGGLGFTSDQAGVIGFQTSSGNWGWADVQWSNATQTLTINEAYVESVPGATITANVSAAPEPGRALLALAGLGGMALRRRRRQVA